MNGLAAARERIVAFVRPGKPSCVPSKQSVLNKPSALFPCNRLAISHKLQNNSLWRKRIGAMRILGIATLCAALAGFASGPSRPLLAQNEFRGSTPPVYQPPAVPPATDNREALSAGAIAALIVKESRSAYYATGRPCACPDDRMRNGHACGGRSAYSRPGGAAPLCYPADVSAEMISTYRARLAPR